MLQVKVVKAFRIRGEIMNPGTLLNVSDDLLGKLGGKVEQMNLEQMEAEYFRLLKRHWELDELGPDASFDECRENVNQLDRLFRELHRQGRKVPVRLPVQKKQQMTQEELAL